MKDELQDDLWTAFDELVEERMDLREHCAQMRGKLERAEVEVEELRGHLDSLWRAVEAECGPVRALMIIQAAGQTPTALQWLNGRIPAVSWWAPFRHGTYATGNVAGVGGCGVELVATGRWRAWVGDVVELCDDTESAVKWLRDRLRKTGKVEGLQ